MLLYLLEERMVQEGAGTWSVEKGGRETRITPVPQTSRTLLLTPYPQASSTSSLSPPKKRQPELPRLAA